MSSIKSTSFEYGQNYQKTQADKYKNRASNYWKHRVELAHRLVEDHALPRFPSSNQSINIVDIGCSIGTFAIEFAKKGFRTFGVDFDQSALEIAQQLATDEGVSPEFVCGDVADWNEKYPQIDIAICFDIFEHLHDDELGAFLGSIRRQLSSQGCLVFHTFPTEYDYIFNTYFKYPILPLAFLSPRGFFRRALRIYALFVDILMLIKKGVTHKELIKRHGHCNPLTMERLRDIMERSGYELLVFDSANLYEEPRSFRNRFARHSLTHRNMYGVAVPKFFEDQ